MDKYITKMDYDSFRGYKVRIRRDNKAYRKYFSINEYGNWGEAKQAARQWRDKVLGHWQKYCGGKDEIIKYRGTNTGYPGVSIDWSGEKPQLRINLWDGGPDNRSVTLPPLEADNFMKKTLEEFEKAKQMVDEQNRKRFGGRWYQYKKRKGLLETT